MVVASSFGERRLHQRLLSGEAAALADAYDQFAATLFGIALRVTTDRHAAEDVTQETLLALWDRPERFDPDRGPLRPWLATIAHNRSVDWIRRERASRWRDRRHAALTSGDVPDISEDVQAVLAAERVRLALAALPDIERLPIRLAYFGGRSYRQVADDLAVPEGTVKSRIRSGLRRLAKTMCGEVEVVATVELAGCGRTTA